MKDTMNPLPAGGCPDASIRSLLRCLTALLAAMAVIILCPSSAKARLVDHDVAAILLKVDQYPGWVYDPAAGDHDNTNVIVTVELSINNMFLGTFNRADINVRVLATQAQDVLNGVLMSSVAQNGRENYGIDNHQTFTDGATQYPISTVHDGWRICSFARSGPAAGNSAEYNVNVAGAWFPYSKYIGGLARNSGRTNGGTNDTLIAHPSLVLGDHFRGIANGRSVLDLTSFGIDSRTDGVLIVNGGKDENNFALSQVNVTNGSWFVYCKDQSQPTFGSFEQDPVVFVYIPRTNTSLISGRFNGDASIDMFSGDSPQFTVRRMAEIGAGRWELKIPGHSPSTGVLIISAEAGGALNTDNVVSYQPTEAGDGWEIQSRDTPGMGLQTPQGNLGEPEAVCSFVFIPAPTPGVTVTPTENLLTSESGGAASFEVVLHAPPKADVTINVSSSNPAEGIPDTAALVFTPANWNIPQTVTVYGMDDAVADGQVAYTIILSAASSADPGYNNLEVPNVGAINADNELGITVSANQLTTTEAGGAATFTIWLNTEPSASVTIGITSSDTTEGTVSPSSVTFDAGNWTTPQTVTVTGVNDWIDDGDVSYTIVTAPATSADAAYNGFNAIDVTVVNLDDDTAGVVINPSSGLVVSESGTSANVSVVLSSEPTANVTVNFVSNKPGEASVSPANRTFTPVNWNVPQTVTVTGVDDLVNDGDTEFVIVTSVTSSDAVYAAINPVDITGVTLDNEPVLVLPSGPVIYGIGTPGIGIDGWAEIHDAIHANYAGGSLSAAITVNGTADDRLEIRNSGTGPGQIGVSGSNVSYGGVTIGAFSGGVGTAPLVITLNSSATPEATQALLRALMYSNVNNSPSLAERTVTITLANAGTSTVAKNIKLGLLRVTHFQEGADHGYGVYAGAGDIEMWATFADSTYPTGSTADGLGIGYNGLIPDRSVLLRFDDIIGDGPGQIPTNAIIVHAELQLFVKNSGDGSRFHRMLIPWDANGTSHASMGDGVQMDDFEARSVSESQMGVADLSGSTGAGRKAVAVTPDVQAWANGEDNYGWIMAGWGDLSGNYDFTAFAPSESENVTERPSLLVYWVPEGTQETSFRFGVNDYTGAVDTRIRDGVGADLAYPDVAVMFTDYEVSAEVNDQEHVLMRFDDIIGTGAGQVPPGATIHAAMLDLSALYGNSPGHGGPIHAMLQPWEATNTWNQLGGGIKTDGVQAAATPTAAIGDASLPMVPGGYHSFLVTTDVQTWANNVRPNYGWAILPWEFGRDGFGIGSAEQPLESGRPRLRVYYTPGSGAVAANVLPPLHTQTSVEVRFTGTVGATYYIWRAGTLGSTWTELGSAQVGGDGVGTFTDNAPLAGSAFYRVVFKP